MAASWRATQKANRRADLLRAAATLFAQRGFAAVSTVELGDAVGMSGPALYNYVKSKDELLRELLIDASTRLLEGGREIIAESGAPEEVLSRLVRFHIDFAVSDPDTIRIQDRELAQLDRESNHLVRSLQRQYVEEWDRVLATLLPGVSAQERQVRLLATFGLLNSTPYSAPPELTDAPDVLTGMATRALLGEDGATVVRAG